MDCAGKRPREAVRQLNNSPFLGLVALRVTITRTAVPCSRSPGRLGRVRGLSLAEQQCAVRRRVEFCRARNAAAALHSGPTSWAKLLFNFVDSSRSGMIQ